jgi:hypothetical protein
MLWKLLAALLDQPSCSIGALKYEPGLRSVELRHPFVTASLYDYESVSSAFYREHVASIHDSNNHVHFDTAQSGNGFTSRYLLPFVVLRLYYESVSDHTQPSLT